MVGSGIGADEDRRTYVRPVREGGQVAYSPAVRRRPAIRPPSVIAVAERRSRVLLHPTRAVVVGYLMATLVGAGLLSLPVASTAPGSPPFETALFTATSAVTVTGLVTVDTATYWTPFGQAVILGLIQIGGLGIMTSASLLLLVAARRVGLSSRLAAQTETQSPTLGDLRRLLIAIVAFTAAFETLVSAVIAGRLRATGAGWGSAAWEGLFHGVSAFNNAGFSLYSDNLVGVATDGWILIPVGPGGDRRRPRVPGLDRPPRQAQDPSALEPAHQADPDHHGRPARRRHARDHRLRMGQPRHHRRARHRRPAAGRVLRRGDAAHRRLQRDRLRPGDAGDAVSPPTCSCSPAAAAAARRAA